MTVDARFFAKLVPEPTSGCWLWTAANVPSGYGIFCPPGERFYAHRWAYERFVGPIPDGHQIHHVCRTPSCVNPAHMRTVTPAEHALMSEPAQRTHCPHGHAYDAANTRRHSKTGARQCRACHRESAARARRRLADAA